MCPLNVRPKGIRAQYRSSALAVSLIVGAGCGSAGLVWAVPAIAVPLATASAVVGAAWPVATWLQSKYPSSGEVRDE